MKNGLRVSEQSGNVEVMSERVPGHRAWLYLFTSPCPRILHIRSVYENNQLGLTDGLSELRCQLMHGHNMGGFVRNDYCETRRNFPTDGIITPERVSVSNDKFAIYHPRFTSSRTVPPAASS